MGEQDEIHGDNFSAKGPQSVAKDRGSVVYQGVPLEDYTRAIREEERANMRAERLAEHLKELQECFREIRADELADQAAYLELEILLFKRIKI
ncbi:hypothetical protein [Candidatus Electrothrix sp.]|uniref:hypothetical protein n=1 Tax=Candidatus Electrothrix sp. TaxID=2170559 RepID=UPI004056AE3E